MQHSNKQVQGFSSISFVMQQKLISYVINFEQLSSDLHARVGARFTVELRVGVEDSSIEVFDALDDASKRSGSLMLT